jgi:hypothetical protein
MKTNAAMTNSPKSFFLANCLCASMVCHNLLIKLWLKTLFYHEYKNWGGKVVELPSTDIVRIHMVNHGSLAVTIPKQVAKELNLEKGMKMRAKAKEGKLEFKQY